MAEERVPEVRQVDPYRWEVAASGGMRVPGLVFADAKMMATLRQDQSLRQVENVAHLPGILRRSFAMPDIHWGYGFPIGGVAAFDEETGVVSPGGVGYDINCGVRLLRTEIRREEIRDRRRDLVAALFHHIPTGVGSRRRDLRLEAAEVKAVLDRGAGWAVGRGFGRRTDPDFIEEGGRIPGADPEAVSPRALERGRSQLGTLGSGNHFVEVGYVAEVYDEAVAGELGLRPDHVTVIIHTGSRGLGYQVCDDFLRIMVDAAARHGIDLPDRQLCCAPLRSDEGRRYLRAMAAAANFAFANRQVITHWVRQTFEQVLGRPAERLGLEVVYDVCHNMAKWETHRIDGRERRVCVHRKGATRAFPPGHPDIPEAYRRCGQPVLIPGDMGRYSYVLVGTEQAFQETFGSTCHGAGRMMSRAQAKRIARGRPILRELEDRGITVRSDGPATLQEEISEAYKDVADVVEVVHRAGISRKVAKLVPVGVIKG
ncbi:MAG: RtcB family protein [Acidobacteria bacterium]|nr:RtcB family protein [Acidobacteriota bacterium]